MTLDTFNTLCNIAQGVLIYKIIILLVELVRDPLLDFIARAARKTTAAIKAIKEN